MQPKASGVTRPHVIPRFRFIERGFIRRMIMYTTDMYPFPTRIVSAILFYSGFASLLSLIHGTSFSFISATSLVGIASVFLLLFILRLMDELKDKELDYALFRHRPLPSGKVHESDIRFSIAINSGLYLLLNVFMGETFPVALFALAYAFLMFRFFFIPAILKRSLLLTLATHNPIIPIMFGYVVSLYLFEHKPSLREINFPLVALLILQFWAMSFAWEIARKIRSKEEENEYLTYSQTFGRVGAVMVAATAQSITLGVGIYFHASLDLSPVYLAFLFIAYGSLAFGYARFLLRPSPETSKLRPFAEAYILSILAASVASYFLSVG